MDGSVTAGSIGKISLRAITGLLVLEVGKPGRFTLISGIVAITGVLIRIIAAIIIILRSSWYPLPLILMGILLMLGGMLALGISTLRGDKIDGWQAWTPILISIIGLIVAAIFSINMYIHFILLGILWGLCWMLVGYVVISYATINENKSS